MKLFVGNLNPDVKDSDLEKLFSEFGEIISLKVVKDPITGDSRGFGFVEYSDRFHAMDAIDALDGTFYTGNIISVKNAKQNNPATSKPGNFQSHRKRNFKPRFDN